MYQLHGAVPARVNTTSLRTWLFTTLFASIVLLCAMIVPASALATAPVVTLTATPGPATNDTTPDVSFSATGSPTPTYTCAVDGGAAGACTSPFTAPTLSNTTSHSITVTATNVNGSDS